MPEEPPAAEPAARPSRSSPTRKALPVITQNRLLVGLILIVTALAFAALIGLGVLALTANDPPTEMPRKFADACDFIVKVALGAVVGLVGGFAAGPGRMEVGPPK